MATSKLEKDIAAMLADGARASSANVAQMIERVEQVVAVAERTAAEEEVRALDLQKSPDPDKARTARDEVLFARDRLRAALPKLQQQLAATRAAEEAARWSAEYRRVRAMVEAEEKRFAECRDLMAQLAERFASARAIDEEVHRVNASSPPGSMHLYGIELTARELQSFSTYTPSIIERAVLQTWEPGGRQLWPPPRRFDPSMFALVPYDPRFSWEWWKVAEEKRAIEQQHQQNENEKAEAAKREFYGIHPAS